MIRSRRDRTCGDKLSPLRIDLQIQAFEGAGTEELEIPGLAKNDLVNGKERLVPHDCKSDTPRHLLAVCHHEADVLLFSGDAEALQQSCG